MLVTSSVLLVYTAVIVPAQICIWNYDDPCSIFPTLPFDIAVDAFFLVRHCDVSLARQNLPQSAAH
jgi:hypothetical protein